MIVLNFEDYMKSCMSHLEEKQHDHETGTNNYYEKVDNAAFERSKMALQALLDEGLDNEILSKAKYEAMCPGSKKCDNFYANF